MGTLIVNPYQNFFPVNGLQAYYDPSDVSTITESSGTISIVADKSGNNFDLTQNYSTSPTYNSTGLNNKGVIVSGGGAFSTSASVPVLNQVGGATLVSLRKYPAGEEFFVNSFVLFVSSGLGAAPTRAGLNPRPQSSFLTVSGRRLDSDGFQSVLSTTSSLLTSGEWLLEIGEFDYANGVVNHWTNGVQDITDASFQTPGLTSNTNSYLMIFGNSANFVPSGTELALSLIYNRTLSTSERLQLESYVKRKWNLTF